VRDGDYFMPDDSPAEAPFSESAERTILGALLLDSSRIVDVANALQPEDFFLSANRMILDAMLAIANRDGAIDIVTLCQYLTDHGQIEAVGGWSHITDLTNGLPRQFNIDEYLEIIKNKSTARKLISLAMSLSARANDSSVAPLETAAWAIGTLTDLAKAGNDSVLFDSEQMAVEAIQRLIDAPEGNSALPTGIQALDEFTGGGIRLGELWVIGAAPSRGKTTLARQIIKHNICRGVPCYAHSGEMSKQSWWDVTACLIQEMPAWKIREPKLMNLTDKEQLREAIKKLRKLPFHLSDQASLHLDKLIWAATYAKKRHDVKLIAIDYVQILAAQGRDPRERVTNCAQRLRQFAKDENVAVLLLSQSPRPDGRSINARPTMFSLKESGALEEAAHTVILPYRPCDDAGVFTGQDELIIGKQRWGSIGSVNVFLNGEYLKFEGR
jgi:replicative DNA helicase